MSEEIRASADFDVEAALSEFLADQNATELQLPALDTEQRKKAKKLAEEYPEVKCESYGFGVERRLHLFKQGAPTAKGKESDSKKENLTGQFVSEGSTAVSGVSPEEKQDGPTSEEGAAVALPTPGYQIRNTFIHINEGPGTDVVDQRAVQSMPHGMFSQCLQEEQEKAPSPIVGSDSGSAKEATEPTPAPVEAPKEIFAPGTEVVIEGLTKYPGFNGLHGTVQSLDPETGRYNVQLSSADGSNGQSAKIKGENLRMTVPPPPPFESRAGRTDEVKSTMQARAPDFVPMQCMGMTSVPQSQPWQDVRGLQQPLYDHPQYDPYSYPPPAPPMMFAAR
mmetsp:Transcript_19848/g.24462  ORF Transcript_19848/g.24462 Transcript_19848/m.24462 type:complete len:336 (+) Transcript_19848:93-1100(+)|eukprot:CAMPEP_0114663758 /NCGR_PEP_ID=MMETSP0191-20121206/27524_1 /TAXON_ID=126664 /ORGANISM="Sorites sp." /LENGTH=335 /DNA_ID=CAMNT_0001904013 /DNA_START=89 /DNA_END=1096 /DNA_ORIENTATION=+